MLKRRTLRLEPLDIAGPDYVWIVPHTADTNASHSNALRSGCGIMDTLGGESFMRDALDVGREQVDRPPTAAIFEV